MTGQFTRTRRRGGGCVRIVTYHGVCRDGEEEHPWIPHFFVTQQQLDRQLTWLGKAGSIVSFPEACEVLNGPSSLRSPVYVITFDDGYFNNLSLALPVLVSHDVTATFFITTGPVDEGGTVHVWMQARMIRHLADERRLGLPSGLYEDVTGQWGSILPTELAKRLAPTWSRAERLFDSKALDGVRHLSVEEVRQIAARGMGLGAHTVTHPFLSRLGRDARRREIAESVETVRGFAKTRDVPFAYPNGEATDFGDSDIQVLRELGVPAAVTTVPGSNRLSGQCDPYRLHRLAVAQRRTREAFEAVISGLHDHDRWWQPPD